MPVVIFSTMRYSGKFDLSFLLQTLFISLFQIFYIMAGIQPPDNPALENERLSPGSVTRYLSSGSARRKTVKDEDCKFCRRTIGGRDLINHLETQSYCRIIYCRMFRVKTLEDLLLKKFSCQSCYLTKKTLDLKKHLEEKRNCLEAYRTKFDLNDVEDVIKKVKALKRAVLPSRSKTARALKYGEAKKKEITKNTTEMESLNEMRSNINLGNYRLCVIFKSNFGQYGAREVKEEEEIL